MHATGTAGAQETASISAGLQQRQSRSQSRAQLLAELRKLWKRIPTTTHEIVFLNLQAGDLGHTLTAFGLSPIRDPSTIPAIGRALTAAIAAELTPAQKVTVNRLTIESIDEDRGNGRDFALKDIERLAYPFKSRLRLETMRSELLQKLPSLIPADAATGRSEAVRTFIEGLWCMKSQW